MDAASLVISVLSLGLQAHEGLSSYIGAIESRNQDLSSASRQSQHLQQLLVLTTVRVLDLQRKYPQPSSHTSTCLRHCKDEIQALDDLLTSLADSTTPSAMSKLKDHAKRFTYPLNRGQIKKVEDRVHKANSALQNALQTLGLEVATSVDRCTERIESKVDAIQSDTSTIVPIHQTTERTENKVDDLTQFTKASLIKIDRTTETIESQVAASNSSAMTAMDGIQSSLALIPNTIGLNTDKVLAAMAEHIPGPTNRLLQNQADQAQISQQNATTLSTITRQLEEVKLFVEASNRSSSAPSMASDNANTNIVLGRLVSKPNTMKLLSDSIAAASAEDDPMNQAAGSTPAASMTSAIPHLRNRFVRVIGGEKVDAAGILLGLSTFTMRL